MLISIFNFIKTVNTFLKKYDNNKFNDHLILDGNIHTIKKHIIII